MNERSDPAIERKHQNISAILIELGFPYIRGYKPLSNYQRLLSDVVRDRVQQTPGVIAATRARAEEPLVAVPPVAGDDLLSRLVATPVVPERRLHSILEDRERPRPLANYFEIEARNRRLGSAGEEFALRFEHERLWRAGRKQLAERIEHVLYRLFDFRDDPRLFVVAGAVEATFALQPTQYLARLPSV